MRYLLAETQEQEIIARQQYLYDIHKLYFVPENKTDGFIPLVPLGTAEPSILFIVGHYDQVEYFLNNNIRKIKEETIVLITCFSKKFKKYKKYKNNLFVSTSENEFSYCYDGKNYGFDFDVTESEVNYYISSHSDIMKRIEKSFQRL